MDERTLVIGNFLRVPALFAMGLASGRAIKAGDWAILAILVFGLIALMVQAWILRPAPSKRGS